MTIAVTWARWTFAGLSFPSGVTDTHTVGALVALAVVGALHWAVLDVTTRSRVEAGHTNADVVFAVSVNAVATRSGLAGLREDAQVVGRLLWCRLSNQQRGRVGGVGVLSVGDLDVVLKLVHDLAMDNVGDTVFLCLLIFDRHGHGIRRRLSFGSIT